MIQACVIGLSKIGQIHCKNLIKIKKTQLTYIYDKNQKLQWSRKGEKPKPESPDEK